jgi:hypothetical protein
LQFWSAAHSEAMHKPPAHVWPGKAQGELVEQLVRAWQIKPTQRSPKQQSSSIWHGTSERQCLSRPQ